MCYNFRDIDQMANMVNCTPIWLDACGADSVAEGWPIPNQTRVNFRNEHSAYIFTWFTLCGVTSWMWIRQCIQKLPLL